MSLKRREAIELITVHFKAVHRVNRCHLKGSVGDSLHALLCAAGFDFRWLLHMRVEKGIGLFCPCFQQAIWAKLATNCGKFLQVLSQVHINGLGSSLKLNS